MKKQFQPTTIKYDGDVSTLKIKQGLLLVRVDMDFYRNFSGIEVAETWADLSPDYAGRHGEVIISTDDYIPKGVVVFFSYMSALSADRIISQGEIYYLVDRRWCFLMVRDGIQMLNGYLLAENVKDEHGLLVQYDEKSFWAKVHHAGELDQDNAHPNIHPGDVVLYRMALEVKLEGLKKYMDRDYRVLQRAFCIAKRHDEG